MSYAVNKGDARRTFVNRLSAQQRVILRAVAVGTRADLEGHRFTHAVAHPAALRPAVFGLPMFSRDRQPTASQRASLSRSLRRLACAGYITRHGSAIALTARGKQALDAPTKAKDAPDP